MKFKAVLFDVDGTLVDSLGDLADSMNITLHRFGFPVHEPEEYKYFVGDGMENLVRRALPDGERHEEAVVRKCLLSMRSEYAKRWKTKTRPYDGIPALLDSLTHLGIRMAILSNKPDDFTRQVVSELLPRWQFEQVVGERPSIPRKPDPTSALWIAGICKIPPADFLYVGDTGTDMRTANAAGMYAVGVLWGFREADELLMSGARVLIKSPSELITLL